VRLLFVTGSYPPVHCGIAEQARDLAIALASRHSVTVMTSRVVRIPAEANALGIRWIGTDWGLRALPSILLTIIRSRPDLVHLEYPCTPYRHSLAPVLLPILLKASRIRTVVRLHEFTAAHPLRRAAVAFMASCAARVLVPSQRDARALQGRSLGSHKIVWFPNSSGIPIQQVDAQTLNAVREHLCPDATLVACFFGYLSRTKDIGMLVEAVRRLLSQIPRAYFVFIGGGNTWAGWTKDLETLRLDPDVGRRIRWGEYANSADVSTLLQISDLALLPFADAVDDRHASFLDALGHGLPTVATGSVADEQRYPAVLVSPGDVEGFCRVAIELGYDLEKRRTLASRARNWKGAETGGLLPRYERAIGSAEDGLPVQG
jgi:glycosyltransferase involved in cell wall biosynthesis